MNRRIGKHILFTATGIGLTFGALSLLNSENSQRRSIKQRFRDAFSSFKKRDEYTLYRDLRYKWNEQSQGEKLAFGIVAVNTFIFGLWQIPRLSTFMKRYFVHDPTSGRAFTLFTSAYSHQSVLHLFFNMYALYGFLPLLQRQSGMSWEQTLAFYNSAALASSLVSHVWSVLISRYRIIIPSLGASGGIWGVLVGTAVVAPYIGVGIIFIPGISFSISEFIPYMMALDVAGVILGWRTFDHIAHLTGAGFGFLYLTYGREKWLEFQKFLKKMKSI